MNELPEGAGDAELIARVRAGDRAAYGVLYERHVGAAQACARAMVRNRTDADDLVNEAFTRVLNAMKNNGGPEIEFRPYLLASVRNVAYDRTRKNKRIDVVEDVDRVASLDALSSEFDFGADAERSIIATAYATLPERWRMVLWHTEVEGMSPADVAPLLGIAPNAVAALAYRAREGLRQAYLQAHVLESSDADCQWVINRLSAFARDRLPSRERVTVENHLDHCEDCRARYAEITHVNSALQYGLLPLVVGPGAAAGYLKLLAAQSAHAAGVGAVVRHASRRAARSVRSHSTVTIGVAAAAVVAVAVAAGLTSDGGSKPEARSSAASQTTSSAARSTSKAAAPSSAAPAVDGAQAPAAADPSVPVATANVITTPASSAVPTATPTTAVTDAPATPSAPTTSSPAPSTSAPAPAPSTTTVVAPAVFDAAVSVEPIGEQVLDRPGAFSTSVKNSGASAATNVTVAVSVSGASTLVAKTASGTCTVAAPTLTCTIPTIAAGETADVLVTYETAQANIAIDASITAAGDTDTTNNATSLAFVQAPEGVSPRFVALDRGDFTQSGNSLLTCNTADFGCAAAQAGSGSALSNNSWVMTNVDVDADPTTFNSSSSNVSIPTGSEVMFAGLYWGADTSAGLSGGPAPDLAKVDQVTLTGPDASHALTADTTFRDATRASRYQGFVDVTSIVAAEGAGTYTLANVQTGTGLDRYAGWVLVVAYRNSSLPMRSLYAFDGLRVVSSGSPIDVLISGFTYTTGKRASLGVLAYEGDAGVTGDGLTVNGAAVGDAVNPANDVFNSTSSSFGVVRTDRSPADSNTFGFDADLFDISSVLANGVDQANLRYGSTGDRYLVGSVTVAVDR